MSIFNTTSNATQGQIGIRWNIKSMSPTEHPDYHNIITSMEGNLGDVYIITDTSVAKIKKVSSVYSMEDEQDNAINIYIDNSLSSIKRINYFWGWYFDAKFIKQSIKINGQSLFCPVYFWDANANNGEGQFVPIQIGYVFGDRFYIDNMYLKKNVIDNLWKSPSYEEESNSVVLPMVRINDLPTEEFIYENMYLDKNVINSLWKLPSYEEHRILKVSNEIKYEDENQGE